MGASLIKYTVFAINFYFSNVMRPDHRKQACIVCAEETRKKTLHTFLFI